MESEILTAKSHPYGMINLLAAENLPVEDLPANLENFRVAVADGQVIGAAGLELYGDYGLLRSVVVSPLSRGKGIANELLTGIENLAASKKLSAIYLLTETARDYFSRKGYQQIARDEVPVEVKTSTEFSHVCPVSAIIMKKDL